MPGVPALVRRMAASACRLSSVPASSAGLAVVRALVLQQLTWHSRRSRSAYCAGSSKRELASCRCSAQEVPSWCRACSSCSADLRFQLQQPPDSWLTQALQLCKAQALLHLTDKRECKQQPDARMQVRTLSHAQSRCCSAAAQTASQPLQDCRRHGCVPEVVAVPTRTCKRFAVIYPSGNSASAQGSVVV